MKKLLFLLLSSVISHLSSAQNVGIGTTTPNASAMVDIASADKGLLIPRMTTAQRAAIANPANGLMVMDTTSNSLWYFNGTSWGELSSVTANIWNKTANDIFNTNTGNVGIGTTAPNANALLHVNLGTSTTKGLLVTGTLNLDQLATVPDLGPGSRMMFYPGKSAFRAGYVAGTQWNNSSVGKYSVAMGYSTTASGWSSTAMGTNTTASGQFSTAMGYYTTASGESSTAIGQGSIASGSFSSAIGWNTTAKGCASTVVGLYNDPLLTSDEFNVTSTTPLFIVGNGGSNTSRSNALVVRKDGNVGIGDNAPGSRVHIKTNSDYNSGHNHLHLIEDQAGDYTRIRMTNTGNSNFWDFASRTDPSTNINAELNYYYSGLGGNALSIKGNGNAWLAGTLTQNSDVRLKKDIHQIQNALPLLMQLTGYNYNWKNEKMDQALQSGVLAQEVQKVFPQLVKEDADGVLSVNYNGLTPYMIEAIKEQQKQLSVQQEINLEKQKEIDDLKKENTDIKTRLQKLEQLLLKQ